MTLNEIVKGVTDDYIANLNPDDNNDPQLIEEELVRMVGERIMLENATRPKGSKIPVPHKLFPSQIASILLHLHHIANINCTGGLFDEEGDILAMYQDSGENEGLYTWSDTKIRRLIQKYNYLITSKEIEETIECLRINAPRVTRTIEKDLIPCNNGIFNFKTKEIFPFSPDKVYLSKLRVNYNCFATNVVIQNPDGTFWDVESWMDSLSDDKEIVNLLWQVLSAVVRPYNRWKKVVWFYADTGNNGKGTLTELARSLVGEGSYASISVAHFGDRFALEPLLHSTAIINDENSNEYIDKADVFKAVATNDVVSIERKYKPPINYQFFGLQIQCTNEPVRFKDKTDSLYRRQLVIPFDKCFTGVERPYIKMDYLHRTEVLEYVLYKVLNMNFYEFSEPQACKLALEDYKLDNDPVRQFWNEISDELVWNVVPFKFLFDLYCAWMRKNVPYGKAQSKQSFKKELKSILRNDNTWVMEDGKKYRVKPYLVEPEPMISEYGLVDWRNRTYTGCDLSIINKTSYEGVVECIQRKNIEIVDSDEI